MFDDIKEFYCRKGFLDEFSKRGYIISYPEDELYTTNHLNYLKNLAAKHCLEYNLTSMDEDEQVEYLESCIDHYFKKQIR